MINGPTPIHLIDAPVQGSGKSLLAEILCSVFGGRADASVIPKRGEEDEWRKSITSALKTGSPFVWYDNLKTRLDSGSLAHAITAPVWTDRAMATHNQITLPVRCVWIITGNNIECDGDFPRRSLWIRLDAKTERPEDREGFI
jgi:putative DNA primase/helicase